jgi:hypothetical protein
MLRTVTWFASASLLVLAGAASLFAQESWPEYPGEVTRGPGFYLAL